jgi:hypothetical protein
VSGHDPCATNKEDADANTEDKQPQNRRFRHRQSFTLKGQSIRSGQPGGKCTPRPIGSELINVAAASIRFKKVTGTVKSQPFRIPQSGGENTSRAVRREFIDITGIEISCKQVACTIERQCIRHLQPGGESAYHPIRRDFVNLAAVGQSIVGRTHKQISGAIKSQRSGIRRIQTGGKGALGPARREFRDKSTGTPHKQRTRTVEGQ